MAVRRTGIPWQLLAFLVWAHLFPAASCGAAEFHNALSLQGFTGLLNTPNAEVTDEGKVYLLYSNQQESQWRRNRESEKSYMFSL